MRKRLKLSKYRQGLVADHVPLVQILAKYFVQHRQHWQRAALSDDLEGEGFLALCKAARTYDKTRLPYPKAYFARAILNGMLKWIKKATRQPGTNKISLAEAADLKPEFDQLDHLRLAIEALPYADQEIAIDRFMGGKTLRSISEIHEIPLRVASLRSARLAKTVAASLDIRLVPRDTGRTHPGQSSTRACPPGSRASSDQPSRKPGQSRGS